MVPRRIDPAGEGSAPRAGRSGEFRVHARRNVRLRALVTHIRSGWQRSASVANLGLGGARIRVEELLAVSDVVTLSFVAPTLWDPLVIRARVAWVAAPEAGVAFEHKSLAAVFALFELVGAMAYE